MNTKTKENLEKIHALIANVAASGLDSNEWDTFKNSLVEVVKAYGIDAGVAYGPNEGDWEDSWEYSWEDSGC